MRGVFQEKELWEVEEARRCTGAFASIKSGAVTWECRETSHPSSKRTLVRQEASLRMMPNASSSRTFLSLRIGQWPHDLRLPICSRPVWGSWLDSRLWLDKINRDRSRCGLDNDLIRDDEMI